MADLTINATRSDRLIVSHGENRIRIDGRDATLDADHFVFAESPPPLVAGLTITGTDADEDIAGGPGGDTLFSGGGNDTLIGNGGDDVLLFEDGNIHRQIGKGGSGADIFVLRDGAEARIRDFDFAKDRVDLSDWGVTGLEELTIIGLHPSRLIVEHEDNRIRVDTREDGFDSQHFIFAGAPEAWA